ncbi:hypothetical protein ZIOFF_072909 [Zingiber officinale]|uniref:THH1/TOM1/TOM3 domain-containing protein n=1 Tax=Zingiber officinale TaxID=94328 RepID=A0A8J5E9W2_ZINOF|nr:hypothetical protein ZIOFF_072909 [Zingiber officinale]
MRISLASVPPDTGVGEAIRFFAGEGSVGNVMTWWEDVDGSVKGQRDVFYALCASYALVSLVALCPLVSACGSSKTEEMELTVNRDLSVGIAGHAVLPQFFSDISFYDFVSPQIQLIRIQLRVPGTGWTTQKVFHLMNFVVSGLRAVLFGLYQDVFLIKSKALEMALLDLPSLLFFSTYTLLVLFWAEIYYQARNLPINNLRRSYLIINGAVYIIQICIWAYVQISRKPVLMEVAKLFLSVVSFLAALAFLIYGGRLFIMLRRFPIESKGRQKKLNEVSLSVFDHDADLDVLDHPVFNFIYYMLVEIFPCALVLFILRKLPPKRFSGAYNPIN